ncbi:MAG TPA: preprotein translocase subunit SecE [Acidimicrobiales bacterium]|nr:preprotein translocase subunit SecE [Acidimicrobiales bacterium]
MNRQLKGNTDQDDGDDGIGVEDAYLEDLDLEEYAHARRARRHSPPVQYLHDVRAELRRVAWPTRTQVVNYSMVVFVTLVLVIALIFALSLGFTKGVTYLFQP